MQLYAGPIEEFISLTQSRQISPLLEGNWQQFYHYRPGYSEVQSWEHSLTDFAGLLMYANLRPLDVGVIVEMGLPLTSRRIDCTLTGNNRRGKPAAVLVELKQWSAAHVSEIDDCVETFIGGKVRSTPHPSIQAQQYAAWLRDTSSAFVDEPAVTLDACSWLHNMRSPNDSAIRADRFASTLAEVPTFTADQPDDFSKFLTERISRGDGLSILERTTSARYAPSKRLMQHTAQVIKGEPVYRLLDEQIVAYHSVFAALRRALKKPDHAIVLIRGGPGTGKSVIALNAMAALLKVGVNAHYVTGSKAFTETLWRILGSRSKPQFRFTNNYGDLEPRSVDVLIVDEAHRIRAQTTSRFKKPTSDRPQIDELIGASKVTVFMIDDHQAVRHDEVGSSRLIQDAAVRHAQHFYEVDLNIQFRCGGSARYVDWIDKLLDISKGGPIALGEEAAFEFQILDNPTALDSLIRSKAAAGELARVTAGFCWPWSKKALADGSLEPDVQIGSFRRPWNAHPEATGLAKGIPKASYWATDPNGIEQIGCIYTAQGFEFGYCGVIFGTDIVVRNGVWIGQPHESRDSVVKRGGTQYLSCVQNAYRVLLTRGLKGCFVYFQDDETRTFVENRL